MDTRKLVYTNIANGCSAIEVANAFGLTLEEVDKAFSEVSLKLAGKIVFDNRPYVATQSQPRHNLPIETDADRAASIEIRAGAARQNRMQLLPILESLDLDAGLIERIKNVRHAVTRREA